MEKKKKTEWWLDLDRLFTALVCTLLAMMNFEFLAPSLSFGWVWVIVAAVNYIIVIFLLIVGKPVEE
jgi:hypothetical protein